MPTKENKKRCYRLLAEKRFAKKPDDISVHQWAAVKSIMERRFYDELNKTPFGLYTSEQIWNQTFKNYLL